ncbi:hypothetical protein [Pseudomonas putida]|uniref:hypothetical protein n=1 Tax=Pseudomonas putida TaxID=303 RepID=UPI0015E6C5C1|nr:hypothetical protein [Pseudomonas putida]
MARKQETPATPVEAKEPAEATESSTGQTEGSGSSPSPNAALAPEQGEAGAPAAALGSAEGSGQVTREGQATASSGVDVIEPDQGAGADVSVSGAAASEGASQVASDLTDSGLDTDPLAEGDQVAANLNPATLQIYPLRLYMDEGELRRRGGPAYTVARRHAEDLVQRKLASLEPLKE